MYINDKVDLHETLRLHEVVENGQCSCGLVYRNGNPLVPPDCGLAAEIVGEDVLRRLSVLKLELTDYEKLRSIGVTRIDDAWHKLSDKEIMHIAQCAQAEHIAVAIKLYKKFEFPVGRAVLYSDKECKELAEKRWNETHVLAIQAQGPIELGWNKLGETTRNITAGNKARVYERDGVIAIQHCKTMIPLSAWTMRCYQLFDLVTRVCDKSAVTAQVNQRCEKLVKRLYAGRR